MPVDSVMFVVPLQTVFIRLRATVRRRHGQKKFKKLKKKVVNYFGCFKKTYTFALTFWR